MARTLFFQLLCMLSICNSDAAAFVDTALPVPLALHSALLSEFSTAKVDIHSAIEKESIDEFTISYSVSVSPIEKETALERDSNQLMSTEQCLAHLQVLVNEYQADPDSDLFPFTDSLIINLAALDSSFHRSINDLLCLDRSIDLAVVPNLSTRLFSDMTPFQELLDSYEESVVEKSMREAVAASVYVFEYKTTSILDAENLSRIRVKKLLKNKAYKLLLTTFSEYEDAIKVVRYLSQKTSEKEMQVLIDKRGDYSSYEILIQGFADRNEAARYLKELSDLGIY